MKGVEYFIWSLETGSKTDKEHGQSYVRFAHAVSMKTVKRRLNSNSVHLERRRGTEWEASSYCWKECEPLVEVGDRPTEDGSDKAKSVFDKILTMLGDGASNADIMREYPGAYARYSSGIEKMRMEILSEKLNTWREVMVTYIWGETGAGKTRTILEGVENPRDVYRVTDYRNPFDGYRGQSILMFEEFRSSLPIEQMLIYLDGYYHELPCRYANKVSGWTDVYIVTNVKPSDQFRNVAINHPETFSAWERRINAFIEVNSESAFCTGVTKGNTGNFSHGSPSENGSPDEEDWDETCQGGSA